MQGIDEILIIMLQERLFAIIKKWMIYPYNYNFKTERKIYYEKKNNKNFSSFIVDYYVLLYGCMRR